MHTKKAIKKIIAIGAGATMVGATLLGAMAASSTLADYPAPFVKDGKFNALIVVGDTAAAEDIVGAVDVGASLQYAMRKSASAAATGEIAVVDTGVEISKSSNSLNYNEDLFDVMSKLDSEDLPDLLADGNYVDSEGETDNEETYTQELALIAGTGTVMFFQDDDDAPTAADYLYFAKNAIAYNYTLEFDDTIEYQNTSAGTEGDEDLETTTIKIQGNVYTITDVEIDALGLLDELTMMAGETVVWFTQGKTVTKTVAGTEHEVTLVDVSDPDAESCGIDVDGTVAWLDIGETQTINGVTVGVTDAKAVHSQLQDTDICQINVGATEIVLEEGKEVVKDGDEIDGSDVDIMSTVGGEWDGLVISWMPDEKTYLTSGTGSLTDPVFGNFKFDFAGQKVMDKEEISLTASGESAELTFVNSDGSEVSVPWFCTGDCDSIAADRIILGEGEDAGEKLLYATGQNCTGVADVTDCEGTQVLISAGPGEAHVLEIKDIDTGDFKITVKDLTYGTEKTNDYVNNAVSLITLPSGGGDINVNVSAGTKILTVADGTTTDVTGVNLETELGALLTISDIAANDVVIDQDEDGSCDGAGAECPSTDVAFNMSVDEDDDDISINYGVTGNTSGAQDESDTNDDVQKEATFYGGLITYDSDADNDVKLSYPDEEVEFSAFVSPVSAKVTYAGSGAAVTLEPMQVGAARLASEVAGKEAQNNLILVGGPCINAAAAKIMGSDSPLCGEESGIPAGKAIVKLYENGENVALLVAGYEAEDTRRATRVIAYYQDYDLTGSEVEVSGTSLTDISVSAPQ